MPATPCPAQDHPSLLRAVYVNTPPAADCGCDTSCHTSECRSTTVYCTSHLLPAHLTFFLFLFVFLQVLDISALGQGSLTSLTLRKCRNVRDVSGLGGGGSLHTLILDNMHNVEDVSGLSTLSRLHLVDCPGVKEVAMLSTVPTLVIKRCRGIKDLHLVSHRLGVDTEDALAISSAASPEAYHPDSGRGSYGSYDGRGSYDDGEGEVPAPALGDLAAHDAVRDPEPLEQHQEQTSATYGSGSARSSPTRSPPAVDVAHLMDEGMDWVEAAKLQKSAQFRAQQEEGRLREEAARQERLENAERLLEADNARLQEEAEKRAERLQEREDRRKRALARKESVEQAEMDAASATNVFVDAEAVLRTEKRAAAEQERQKRKARVAALLSKVKTVDKLTVMGC